jgi:hypothetical protein
MGLEVNGVTIPNGAEFYVNDTQVEEAYCNGVLIWWNEDAPPEDPPDAITDFTASDNLTGRVKVDYTPSSNATEHDLYRDGSMVKDKVTPGYEDVIAAGTYSYFVKAQNDNGNTDSNTDNGTSLEEQPVEIPPSQITNFQASDDIVEEIKVTFSSATGTPTPTHDLIRVSNNTIIKAGVTSGWSWSTTEQNVLLRVDAKNSAGVTPSNTDYGSAAEDIPDIEPVTDFTASDTQCRLITINYTVPSGSTSQDLWLYDVPYGYGWMEESANVSPGYSTALNSAYFDHDVNMKLVVHYSDGSQLDSNEDTGRLYIPDCGFQGTSLTASSGQIDQITFNIGSYSIPPGVTFESFGLHDASSQRLLKTVYTQTNTIVFSTSDPTWDDIYYSPREFRVDLFANENGCDARETTLKAVGYADRDDPEPDPPGSQVFTSNGTFIAPNGYASVLICMCGAGGIGGSENDGAWGGGAGQVVSEPYSVTPGEFIDVIVGPETATPIDGRPSYFGNRMAGGGASGSHMGNGTTRTTCGGTGSDGDQNPSTFAWGGESSGFGNGGHGSDTGGFHGGIGSGGGGGTLPNYGGNGGRGEVRVSWGMNYWDLIPGYNDMTNNEKWEAILVYNVKNGISNDDIFKPTKDAKCKKITEKKNGI